MQKHTYTIMRNTVKIVRANTNNVEKTTIRNILKGSDVGVGVDVAMGVMVGVASMAVIETVVAARKETQKYS